MCVLCVSFDVSKLSVLLDVGNVSMCYIFLTAMVGALREAGNSHAPESHKHVS